MRNRRTSDSKRDSKRSHRQQNWLRSARIESLEQRRLLASDLAALGDDGDTHAEYSDYWIPESRHLSALSSVVVDVGTDSPSSKLEHEGLLTEIQDYVHQHQNTFVNGLTDDLQFRVQSSHQDPLVGATHVYLQQTYEGLDIINAVANLTVSDATGGLLSSYSSFVLPVVDTTTELVTSSPATALLSLAEYLHWEEIALEGISTITSLNGAETSLQAPSLSNEPIPFEPVFVPTETGAIEPAWNLNVQTLDGDGWLDAAVKHNGDVVFVSNWIADAQYRVFASPLESPYDGPRTIQVNPQLAANSPFGWHDTNGSPGAEFTITSGNNVYAYTDVDGNNVPDVGSSPDGGAALDFRYTMNLGLEPSTYSDASVTNLFYTTNILSDILENYGFDEAAGNFQVTNYSGQGSGGDPVLAEVQDGSGINNANFATPPDGTSPRMQMFLWNLTTPMRDGSLDNGIIAHELGHGVSNRLTGGAANANALTSLTSRGMGEGWSDIISLLMTQVVSDQASDARTIGNYAIGQTRNGPGIRTQPYSYDMGANNHTFGDIVGQTSVHRIGETWATAVWDLNWALINGKTLDSNLPLSGLGFDPDLANGTGGNNMTMRLVLQGMKLQPSNPTFIQARDAILAADQLLNNGLYQQTIWTVFARRGMGVGASAPAGANSTSAIESFVVPVVSPLSFAKVKPLGSLVSNVAGTLVPLEAGVPQELSFFAERNSKIAFHFNPGDTNTVLTATIRRATGAILVPPVSSPGPGAALSIDATRIAGGGNYILELSSILSTGVEFVAARNAVLESLVGDSSSSQRVNLNPSFVALGGGINSVLGTTNLNSSFNQFNNPGAFVDISATGTALNLSDDGEFLVTTTVGNVLFPAGPTTIGNNGGIISAPTLIGLGASNNTVENFPHNAILPFWDDIDADTGNVYWQERLVGGIDTLIVQWDNRPHFSNTGSATFQLQLFESGPRLARFVYPDVVFGSALWDNGASATIGFRNAQDQVSQFSFNTANAVANGDVIDIMIEQDIDYYTFTGQAGQVVDVILDRLNGTQVEKPILRVLDPTNSLLGLGSSKPLAARTTVSNYDQGILSATLPISGTYQIRLLAKGAYDYTLSVTEALAFDTENTIGTLAPLRTIPVTGATLGFMNGGDARDMVNFDLTAGQSVRILANAPFSHPNTLPRNTLAFKINLQAPDLSIVATDQTLNANGFLVILHTATQTGRYRLDLRRLSGSGEYYAKVVDLGSASNLIDSARTEEDWIQYDGPTLQIVDDPKQGQQAVGDVARASTYLEGSTVNLRAVTDDQTQPNDAVYTWDLNEDGIYDDAIGTETSFVLGFIEAQENKSIWVRAESTFGVSETEFNIDVEITPWRNRILPSDVNSDGYVSPLDALLIINEVNRRSSAILPTANEHVVGQSLIDVSGDNVVSPLDALLVINGLNGSAALLGEGEYRGLSMGLDVFTRPRLEDDAMDRSRVSSVDRGFEQDSTSSGPAVRNAAHYDIAIGEIWGPRRDQTAIATGHETIVIDLDLDFQIL